MIDLHCHILPGLDDGARDMTDSVAMARQACVDGIAAVCATPHIRHDHEVRVEEIETRVAALNRRLQDDGIAVEILSGGEVAATAVEDLDGSELDLLALGNGRWVLLEPAPGPLDDSLRRRVSHLAKLGYRALIAHPERHFSDDMYKRLSALIAEGSLIQATADYFLRPETETGMLQLAEAGLVHVLSSDSHSSLAGRPLQLSAAFERLGAVPALAPWLQWISETAPRAIVTGGSLVVPFEPSP